MQSGQQVNVEEYRYDYAGNRIAKIGELSTTYYLVDINGALSQVLAEYNENGSLTTYYTRGEELISQERGNEKHYYLYDGFDSVRILTDENGTATDFYTYDAFGNLTEQIGDTENDFLYRGEQFDSFTGLYYLRAIYMNPSTGTFITMDEYAGSVFEPVSLHKYLYANANPVMYSDPSGYSSIGEMATVCAVSAILCGIVNEGICLLRFFFDDSFSLDQYGGNLALAMLDSFVQGAWSGFIFGGFGYIAAHSILVSTVMIAFCGYSAWQNYSSAWQKSANGNTGGAWIDSSLGAMSVLGALSYANFAYANTHSQAVGQSTGSVKGNVRSSTLDERAAIEELIARGDRVEIIPKDPKAINKRPDFYINGIKTELKTLNGNSMNTFVTRITEAYAQNADAVIIDATKTYFTMGDALTAIERAKGTFSDKSLPGPIEIWTKFGIVRR